MSIEPLESRIAPATLTWDGSVSGNWSDAGNWNTNHVPVDGDTLVFPDLAAHKTNTNDIAGLDLAAIRLNGLNYVIGGNAVTLSAGLSSAAPVGAAFDVGPIFTPAITLTATQSFTNNGAHVVELDGALSFAGFTLTTSGSGDFTIIGALSGVATSKLTKSGAGALLLSGISSGFGGAVALNAGSLFVDGNLGNAEFTVSGGVLGGSGSLGRIISTDGTVTGAKLGTAGILTSNNGITFASATTYAVDLNGTAGGAHDRIAVTGAATLNGAELSISFGAAPVSGNTFTILTASGGVTGTFAGLNDLAVFEVGGRKLQIDYLASSVVLSDVTPSFTWDGGGADNKWTTAANWSTDTAPTPGVELVFPVGPTVTSMVNDFPAGTAFAGVRFTASGYFVQGNMITIGAGGFIATTGVAGASTPITLGASSFFEGNAGGAMDFSGAIAVGEHTLTINANANARVSVGPLSGTGVINRFGGASSAFDPFVADSTFSGEIHLFGGAMRDTRSQPDAHIFIEAPGASFTSGNSSSPTTIGELTSFGGNVVPGSSGTGILTVAGDVILSGTPTASSSLALQVNGTTEGTNYDQLKVLGRVDLSKVTLTLNVGAFTAAANDTFVIINNDGSDPVRGTFLGLPEGKIVTVGAQKFQVSYRGGTGNDVTLKTIIPHADLSNGNKTATYTDLDGDLVTIKTSKGEFAPGDFSFSNSFSSIGGFQLQTINLSDDAEEFSGTNLTITAKRGPLGGDGFVNIGFLKARDTGGGFGIDLGKVSIKGDLGQIDAGDATLTTAAVKSLVVQSMGELGLSTQNVVGSLRSDFNSGLGSLTVLGNLRGVDLVVGGAIGKVTIGGDIRSDGSNAASIRAADSIGALTVKGSVIGNSAASVVITARGQLVPGATSDVAIKSIAIGHDVERALILAGFDVTGPAGVGVNADAQIGKVTVGGNWTASNLAAGVERGTDTFYGTNDDTLIAEAGENPAIASKIASIVIKGQVSGQFGSDTPFGFVAQQIGAFKVGGVGVPLTVGASNDTFALGQARPVGPSPSTLLADGFAVHVLEV